MEAHHPIPTRKWKLEVVVWYTTCFAAQAAVFPFLMEWFAKQGLSSQQLGVINSLRPWISVPASFVWGQLADRLHAHKAIMMACLVVSVVARCLLLVTHGFLPILGMMLMIQVVYCPVGILADAAVVAGCQDGEYGKYRKWGAVGWGSMSVVSGALIPLLGFESAFVLHVLFTLPCLFTGPGLHNPYGTSRGEDHKSVHGYASVATKEQTQVMDQDSRKLQASTESRSQSEVSLIPVDPVHSCTSPSASILNTDTQTQGLLLEILSAHPDAVDAGSFSQNASPGTIITAVANDTTSPFSRAQESDDHAISAPQLPISFHPTESSDMQFCHNDRHHSEGKDFWHPRSSITHLDGHHNECSDLRADITHQPIKTSKRHRTSDDSDDLLQEEVALLQDPTHEVQEKLKSEFDASNMTLSRLMMDSRVAVFLLTSILMGYGFGTIESFLFVFLHQLGANELLMGLTLTITCVAEVPVFQAQPWLLSRFKLEHLLDVVVATYALRMLAYSCLPWFPSPWLVLPIEVLHGITFGLGWGLGTTQVKRLSPPHLAASMQGVFQGCYFGLGYGVGALMGGFVSEHHGYAFMYMTGATVVCCTWACIALARSIISAEEGHIMDRFIQWMKRSTRKFSAPLHRVDSQRRTLVSQMSEMPLGTAASVGRYYEPVQSNTDLA